MWFPLYPSIDKVSSLFCSISIFVWLATHSWCQMVCLDWMLYYGDGYDKSSFRSNRCIVTKATSLLKAEKLMWSWDKP